MVALPTLGGVQAAPKVTPISSPEINLMLEPYTPGGQMRLYTVTNGVSYWTNDLPIYQGDSVKLDVFVATGADDLQELKVRLDNQPIADITKSPWNATLAASQLGSGYHFLETWVQVTGPKPQYLTRTMTFFVSPAPSPAAAMVSAAPPQTQAEPRPQSQAVTAVKGQQQILTNGQIINVPLDNGSAASAFLIPPTPSLLSAASSDPRATVKITLRDPASKATVPLESGPVAVTGPVVAEIAPQAGSTAQRFAYMLARGSQTIVAPTQVFSIDTTNIRLQPRTSNVPGLLPGTTTLWVWGIDAGGNYGAPASVTVQIQTPQTGGG